MLSQGPGIRYALALLRAGRIKRLTEMLMARPGAQEDRTKCSLEMDAKSNFHGK